jgi:hypothetical protein
VPPDDPRHVGNGGTGPRGDPIPFDTNAA